ncbi:class I SAM-dependent methyltransferase [Leptospira noguchii]|uniref:Class I SAM-dependent methyltransferase n=1 Tax=Leptospira noguchii TaxID=28182 RepID=A0AAE9GCI4_9LEPT|nr:class I SAM-dependent methyltransferase [Leptospira noguchii]UOG29268.1 class I SAM-dependent methyltransferase [Leptospira noguchii]UOG35386.1 class I SAM-dependent methyltransferase [Leptospira noguchii]UOG46304.1 class I SAM-dependent methyltransferase [Leptospira noguchii]UOG55413.1 class I SAM-dependent methyltransferase [Leptospira noguchii]
MEKNSIKQLLLSLNIITEDTIQVYYPFVRDRDDVSVLKCSKSNVIFLSRTDHVDLSYYEAKVNFRLGQDVNRDAAVRLGLDDAQRRAEQLKCIVSNKKWLDVGTGVGGILDILKPIAREIIAVEIQENIRKELLQLGYRVFPKIENIEDDGIEVVSLFHVFEHLSNPIDALKLIKSKMKKGGKVVIEVPHARDFLFDFLDCESFKRFTFWSEHLILHTRNSLEIFLSEAGFSNIEILGLQRYPLSNHLYWLKHGVPGGHNHWNFLNSFDLNSAYETKLVSLDRTDTLLAIASS